MNLLAEGLYLLLILCTGYAVLSAIRPQPSMRLVELFALTGTLGAGCIGLLLFWSSLAGYAPTRTILLVIGLCIGTSLCVLWKKNRLILPVFRPGKKARDWLPVIPWLLIGYALIVLALKSLAGPVDEWDGFAIWAFKAKVLAHSALNPVPAYFHDLTLSYSHLDYPLMVPFLIAGDFSATGGTGDPAAKFISLFLDALLVPMIYAGLRWKLKAFPAAALAAVLALLPAVGRYSGTVCADVPLAVFYSGTIIYLARWIARPRWQFLMLAVLFGTFTAFTKNEGLVLALAGGGTIFILGILRQRWQHRAGAIFFFAGLLALHGAWLLWNRQLPRTHEDYGSKIFSPLLVDNFPRLKQILPALMVHACDPADWGFFCGLAAVMIAIGWRGVRLLHAQTAWLMFGMQMASYLMVYIVTPWDLNVLIPTTANRLILQTLPAIFLIAGWHWAAMARTPVDPANTGRTSTSPG
jgi:hypothetical protein